MLLSRRYRNNWGYQIQQNRREPIFQQYLERPNRNHYYYDGYNTRMEWDTLTGNDIQLNNAASQQIIKHKYPGYKPGSGEDQNFEKLMQEVGKEFKNGPNENEQGPPDEQTGEGLYTSEIANRLRNKIGSKHPNWRPGYKGEFHLPTYSYCGPGTNLDERLARGDPGLNRLDRACKTHDIDYALAKTKDDVRAADLRFMTNIKNNDKAGKSGALISTLFKHKMRLEDKGRLSHGKYAYESKNQTKMNEEELKAHRDKIVMTGDGIIDPRMLGRRRKKDPARKLRKKMHKYKKTSNKVKRVNNKALRAALKRIRSRLLN